MTTANANGPSRMLDGLCELILDQIKRLSSTRQALSKENLLCALSEKADDLSAMSSMEHVAELKRRYTLILHKFGVCLKAHHREMIEELIPVVEEAQSLGQLYELLEKIVEPASKSLAHSQAMEKSLASLLIEVGNQLVEVERECLGLIESTTDVHRANNRFTTLLESEITQLESSAQTSEDVSEVRQVLRSRLQTIKSAIEAKKAEDTARKQSFDSTLEKLQGTLTEMQSRIERDRKRRKHLEQEAQIDPLTGIANRRVIERYLTREIKRYKRDKTVFSLIFIDIDDFKAINDTYGHRVGDKCLQILVGRMKEVLRAGDLLGRYGGDEFVVFLTETGQKAAQVVANKLSSAISKTCFVYRDAEIVLSVSIGLTQVEEGDARPEQIIERADSALYEAKNQGKDCIIVT